MSSAYRRVVLKLSGEALGREDGKGIGAESVSRVTGELVEACREGLRLGIVVGAGNLWRGGREAADFDPCRSHQIGMVATVVNALVLAESLRAAGVPVQVYSALGIREIVNEVDVTAARGAWDAGSVLVFGGGTGNPFFSTDSAAALRAVQLQADALFKATKVAGIFEADPVTHPGAGMFSELSYQEALRRELKVMDASAFSLCRENRIPIVVFDMKVPGILVRAARGEPVGTVVRE